MEFLTTPEFWVAVGQIILIDILLGGDNAVVIALACRQLPPKQRRQGIIWGTVGAITLRVVLIFFALQLLAIPFLKVVGALLLLWIGVKLLVPEHEEGEGAHAGISGSDRLWGAVRTVIIADFVMSVDNVIAVSGAAEASGTGHEMALVIFGVVVSIPIIVWGSQAVLKLMDRFPIIITLGGMLLGWIAGTMAVTDPVLVNPEVVPQMPKFEVSDAARYGAGIAGALLVFALGRWLTGRRPVAAAPEPAAVATGAGGLRRILLAVDGSETASRATRHLIGMLESMRAPSLPELQVLNVQRPLTGDVSTFIASKTLEEYHEELAEEALAPARALLDAAGIPYVARHCLGVPGPTIATEAQAQACDMIVMGTRGLGAAASLLGSVAQDTIANAVTPVLLVK